MQENKHIEKELLFNTNIKEITSISLDSEFKVNNNDVVGNFIVSGEYKIHELSINKEEFNYKIPFTDNIDDDVDIDTIKLEIMDFSYDYKDDHLSVKIDYELSGDKKDILEFKDDESLDDFLINRELEIVDTRNDDLEDIIEETEENEVNDIDNKNYEDDILKNYSNKDDNFVTYKVYKIDENDTIESIVIKYHTTIDDLKEYNDIKNLNSIDKIIVPYYE